jgi:hypothetical protein
MGTKTVTPHVSSADQEIAELKEAQRHLEAKLKELIAGSPVLRRAAHDMKMAQLKARANALALDIAARLQVHKNKSEFLFLPSGVHEITPMKGGRVQVIVDEQTATQLEAQRMYLTAKGNVPHFDFDHANGPASFLVSEFFWRNTPLAGTYVRGIFTSAGSDAIKAKTYWAFSPCFTVEQRGAPPHRIVFEITTSTGNMGGLVNSPAFGEKLTLRPRKSDGFY